jgi:hypothetical protein
MGDRRVVTQVVKLKIFYMNSKDYPDKTHGPLYYYRIITNFKVFSRHQNFDVEKSE